MCVFNSPAGAPWGATVAGRRSQGIWLPREHGKLNWVENILLRCSDLSWLLPIYFPSCSPPLATSQSMPINIQSFAPCLQVSISGGIQPPHPPPPKKRNKNTRFSPLMHFFPHPLSSGTNLILTNQWGTKDHFLTAHIKERTLRKLVRSRRFNNQTFSHSRYN